MYEKVSNLPPGSSPVTRGASLPNFQPIGDFGAVFIDTCGNPIHEIALSRSNIAYLGNEWIQVSVPIWQLNPSNVRITEISLKNELDTSLASAHYDDMKLVS